MNFHSILPCISSLGFTTNDACYPLTPTLCMDGVAVYRYRRRPSVHTWQALLVVKPSDEMYGRIL